MPQQPLSIKFPTLSPKEEILVNRRINKALAQKFPDIGNFKKTDALKLLEAWLALGGHNLPSGFLWELKTDGAFMALRVDEKLFVALPKIVGVEIDQLYCPTLVEYWHKITAGETPAPIAIKKSVIAKKPKTRKSRGQNSVSDQVTSTPNPKSPVEKKADEKSTAADRQPKIAKDSENSAPPTNGSDIGKTGKDAATALTRRAPVTPADASSTQCPATDSKSLSVSERLDQQNPANSKTTLPVKDKLPMPPFKALDDQYFTHDRFICAQTDQLSGKREWMRCTGEIAKPHLGSSSKTPSLCPFHLVGTHASKSTKGLGSAEVVLKLHRDSAFSRAQTSLRVSKP